MTVGLAADERGAALAELAGVLGLYFTAFDVDGEPVEVARPEVSACVSSPDCPLVSTQGHCPGASSVLLEEGSAGTLIACHGAPVLSPPVTAAESLARAWLAHRRADAEIDDTVRELATTYQELGLAYGILEAISLPGPREMLAQSLVSHLRLALGASGAMFLLLKAGQSPQVLAEHGLTQLDLKTLPTALADRATRVSEREAPFDLHLGESHLLAILTAGGLTPTGEQGAVGLLAVCREAARPFGSREAKLLLASSRQAALAIRNRALVEELQALFGSTIEALVAAIEAKDPYTCGHSRRVAATARATGEALGLGPASLQDLYTAAIVHDVGKIAVDTAILRKTTGGLSEPQWQEIRRHPERGAGIIGCVPQLRQLAPAVRHHHERPDRAGYPDGLPATQIPPGARIIAVCDSYDAMTSHRPYRLALPVAEARRELRRHSGTQFDAAVASAFLDTTAA
jgi:HD-GYP domain-containing protein (c-di-GMP phosphodiesterase class II)